MNSLFSKSNASFSGFINKQILYNRFILYAVLLISLINMTTIALMGDYVTPIIFFLVALVTSYFNKNMLIILFVSLIFSNVLKYGRVVTVDEGFKENNEKDADSKEENDEEDKVEPKKDISGNGKAAATQKSTTVSNKKDDESIEAIIQKNPELLNIAKTQLDLKNSVDAIDEQINKTLEQLSKHTKNIENMIGSQTKVKK